MKAELDAYKGSLKSPMQERSGSLFGNIANSFMGGSERGLGSKRDSKKEVVAQTEGDGETDV